MIWPCLSERDDRLRHDREASRRLRLGCLVGKGEDVFNGIDRHHDEIQKNLSLWSRKPLLKQIYRSLHEQIARRLSNRPGSRVVELGSGIGNIKDAIPGCLRTDLFPNPWIDQIESAYDLSFPDEHLSDLVLFDVFHHLRYPGTALREFHRVLEPAGRVIIFDPCLSVLGRLVYGLFHHEPIGLDHDIEWLAPVDWSPADDDYYAAQGNATRIFVRDELGQCLAGWRKVAVDRLSAISYVASGGYSKPQLYPLKALPLMRALDKVCDMVPSVFATRLLVVLEKQTPVADAGISPGHAQRSLSD